MCFEKTPTAKLNETVTFISRRLAKIKKRRLDAMRILENVKPERVFYYFEELSDKEISKIMKKNVHAIETLIYRARQSLKSEFLKGGFNYENL